MQIIENDLHIQYTPYNLHTPIHTLYIYATVIMENEILYLHYICTKLTRQCV